MSEARGSAVARIRISSRAILVALALTLSAGTSTAQTITGEQAEAEVIERRQALTTHDRATDPIGWAVAQSDLAQALHRRWDFDAVEEAVVAYRAALEVLTRQNNEAEWLRAQEGLGHALLDMAGRRGLASFLGVIGNPGGAQIDPGLEARDAALAFTEVLSVRTRESDRIGWIRTQVALGESLNQLALMQRMAGRADDIPTLHAAAERAYQSALDALSRGEHLERGSVNQSLSSLHDAMSKFADDRYVENETEFRRLEAERIRQVRIAIRYSETAEREFRRAGRVDLAEESQQRRERLREQLRPNEYW
jgi:hypothetical protein